MGYPKGKHFSVPPETYFEDLSRESQASSAHYANGMREKRRRPRRRAAAIVGGTVAACLVVAAGLFAFWWISTPPVFSITVNGADTTITRGTTVSQIVDDGLVSPTPGNLVALDGTTLETGAGEPFTATVNGAEVVHVNAPLGVDDVVEITDGADKTEPTTVERRTTPYQVTEAEGYGAIHLYQKGADGVTEVTTGTISGQTTEEEVVPVKNETYLSYNADVGDDKVVALTFDDGPWPDTTDEILDILKENGAKATFFTIGNQISSYESSVKRAISEGHQVCTHTWDHASGSGQGVSLMLMSADEQIAEVQKGLQAISDVSGKDASTVIRSPGGNFSGSVVETLAPYISAEINWNVDTEDWRRPGADVIASRIKAATPGEIILMHDGGGDRTQTVAALKDALPYLKSQGYSFITMDELLAYDPPASSSSASSTASV